MNRTLGMLFGSVVIAGVLAYLLVSGGGRGTSGGSQQGSGGEPILLYCAVSNREVIEAICADYQKEYGRQVDVQYGPSQTLLASIEVSGSGDLYLPADDSFIVMGQDKGLVEEVIDVAAMQAVIAVRRDWQGRITKLEDLLDEEIRLVQASPEATAIGKVTRQALEPAQWWERLDGATAAYRGTVNEVAADVMVGAADAGIVYDAVLHSYPELTAVRVDALSAIESPVAIGVLASSRQPTAALHFARYVAARDRGLIRYAEHGFRVAAGDLWRDRPELSLLVGSMLRPAIERTIVEFEQREGVDVTRVYNGCGILVAQMKSGLRPDAYFACDTEFMDQVVDLFPDPVTVSQNELVIAVPKGNPQGIRSLADLTRPGILLGIGHQEQCAMGWLTQNTFRDSGLMSSLMANVQTQTPSGDLLVNQMLTGSLEAAIVYRSNVVSAEGRLEAVDIRGIASSIATQPWAVAQESQHPQLAGRLFQRITSAESRQIFTAEGFRPQFTGMAAADE